jgi:type IV secretory pathway VirD2 relaxase
MTSDSDRKAAEEYAIDQWVGDLGQAITVEMRAEEIRRSAIDFLAGRSSALKELEQIAREAFEAGRDTIFHPTLFYRHEYFTDYWQKKTESKEG